MSLQRETVHEEEGRDVAREASVQRMDLAEERVGLFGDAIETGCEQSDSISVTSHTCILKKWQVRMRAVYPALWWREVRRMRLTVSWDTP
jgi:hypothetical protein